MVCDVGVVISGLLSAEGSPGQIIDQWRDGAFDLVVSALWLDQLERVITRPKIARYVNPAEATTLLDAIVRQAVMVDDPPPQPGLTPDPGDDYLVSLARAADANSIVSGDNHLLGLDEPRPPVLTPRAFLDALPPLPS